MESSASFSVPFEKKDTYDANPDITVEVVDDLSIYYMGFNLHPTAGYAPLQDLALRQAIAAAIDKQGIADIVFEGWAEPADSWIYKESPNHKDDLPNNTYDLTEAAQILTDAGYTKDDEGYWCLPVVDTKTETVTDDTVDATEEADTEVEVDGTATVTVARYGDNPGGDDPTDFNALDKYIDVYVPDTSEVTEIEIRLYYTDAEVTTADVDEESLRLFWWDGAEWNECSPDSGVNTASTNGYSGYMWAKIRNNTTPSLEDLQGTEFGGYGHPSTPGGGFCFIATAAYGTDTASELDILREYRDKVLLPNSLGAEFVSLYYKTSPPIADFISEHEVLRTAVRVGFVDPIVKILTWSHNLWSA
jgi:ABC-type transport system substrate-binding protein